MNKRDFKFIMAYAEAYGLQKEGVGKVFKSINSWLDSFYESYDVSADEIIDDFLNAYQIIKITGFEGECFSMMRNQSYSIWQTLRDWDLPFTVEEAERYMQHIEDAATDYYETQLSCKY